MILTTESFVPSDVMIYLLYEQLLTTLPKKAHANMLYFTRVQMCYGVATTLEYIKDWKCCCDIYEMEFWILDNHNIREEVYREIRKKTDLYKDAEYDKLKFRLRFGEELMIWFLKHPEEAKRYGLKRDNNRVVLVRKKQSCLDITGCA